MANLEQDGTLLLDINLADFFYFVLVLGEAAGAAGEVGLPGAGLLGLALKLGSRVFKENEEEKIKKLGKLYKSTLDSVRDVIFQCYKITYLAKLCAFRKNEKLCS